MVHHVCARAAWELRVRPGHRGFRRGAWVLRGVREDARVGLWSTSRIRLRRIRTRVCARAFGAQCALRRASLSSGHRPSAELPRPPQPALDRKRSTRATVGSAVCSCSPGIPMRCACLPGSHEHPAGARRARRAAPETRVGRRYRLHMRTNSCPKDTQSSGASRAAWYARARSGRRGVPRIPGVPRPRRHPRCALVDVGCRCRMPTMAKGHLVIWRFRGTAWGRAVRLGTQSTPPDTRRARSAAPEKRVGRRYRPPTSTNWSEKDTLVIWHSRCARECAECSVFLRRLPPEPQAGRLHN